MQQRFLDAQGFQCGFCTAGFLMTISARGFDDEKRADLPRALKELFEAARGQKVQLVGVGHWGGSPRSVAFNSQWFRIAVDPDTGEIRILRSVQGADAGQVMNPLQCRGQVEGGVAQALGATLFERVLVGEGGAVTTAAFRRYRLPAYADVPRTEVHFSETSDALGPLGAKSMSESPFNPVTPAFANALRDATGLRFTEAPFLRDQVWQAIDEHRRSSRTAG
jgi:CO/xanthine dehydrogenase Mo-binding subunit